MASRFFKAVVGVVGLTTVTKTFLSQQATVAEVPGISQATTGVNFSNFTNKTTNSDRDASVESAKEYSFSGCLIDVFGMVKNISSEEDRACGKIFRDAEITGLIYTGTFAVILGVCAACMYPWVLADQEDDESRQLLNP